MSLPTATSPLPHNLYRELTKLVTLRMWGEISPEQSEQLESLVNSHPRGYQALADVIMETVALRRLTDAAELSATALTWSAEDQLLVTIAAEQLGNRSELVPFWLKMPRLTRQSLRWGAVAAALALVFWASLAVWVFPQWRAVDPQLATPAASPAGLIGEISAGDSCQWSGPQQPRDRSRLAAGSYQLAAGRADLTLQNGVQLVVAGPTNFELVDAGKLLLHQGLISAWVPPQAIGYQVQTKTASIIDLGTEFAVSVSATGTTDIEVFAGKVSVAPRGNGVRAVAPVVELVAGDLRRVRQDERSQSVSIVPINALSQPAPRRNILKSATAAKTQAPQALFPDNLVAYWNFDESHDNVVWDVRGSNHGKPEGVQRIDGLVGTGAIQFDNRPEQFIRVSRYSADFEFADGITIEVAFQSKWSAAQGDYDTFFRKEDGNRLLLAFQHDGDRDKTAFPPAVAQGPVLSFGLTIAGKYQELDLPLDGTDGRPTVAEMADGKVHHVAATYSSKTGAKAIYVDGRLCYQAKYEVGSLISSGGTAPAYLGSNGGDETFTGVLDELAVYREALSADEIAGHYRRVASEKPYFQKE